MQMSDMSSDTLIILIFMYVADKSKRLYVSRFG